LAAPDTTSPGTGKENEEGFGHPLGSEGEEGDNTHWIGAWCPDNTGMKLIKKKW
jgi:hypothetical protein